MRELQFQVPENYHGHNIKSFLRNHCGLSARLMIKLKYAPLGITKNGQHAKVIESIAVGDMITLCLPDDSKTAAAVSLPFTVLYEDEDILAADKPFGMPMYPTPGHDSDSLANAVAAHFLNKGFNLSFRPVYRLDKDTTGVVILAKNAYAAAALAKNVHKKYVAVCEGNISGKGTISQPIRLKEGHRIQREVHPLGEKAVTHYSVLFSNEDYSFVEFILETGRTHQIRVHLSFLGHPLAGDDFYGGSLISFSRQALHCSYAEFIHPVTKNPIILRSPLPQDMGDFCRQMKWTYPPKTACGSTVD